MVVALQDALPLELWLRIAAQDELQAPDLAALLCSAKALAPDGPSSAWRTVCALRWPAAAVSWALHAPAGSAAPWAHFYRLQRLAQRSPHEARRVLTADLLAACHDAQISLVMRDILLSWMCEVCISFGLSHAVTWRSMRVLDRFLSLPQHSGRKVGRKRLQCCGAAALMLVCRAMRDAGEALSCDASTALQGQVVLWWDYKDKDPTNPRIMSDICDRAYTPGEVRRMARHMRAAIPDGLLTDITPAAALDACLHSLAGAFGAPLPRPLCFLARFTLDVALTWERALALRDYTLALAALASAFEALNGGPWPEAWGALLGAAWGQLQPVASELTLARDAVCSGVTLQAQHRSPFVAMCAALAARAAEAAGGVEEATETAAQWLRLLQVLRPGAFEGAEAEA